MIAMAMGTLGDIIRQFRGRYRLSKAAAARILGCSTLYIRSLESGADVRTGLPFRPREATLRQIATKMSEFGYPMAFEKLMAAIEPQHEVPPESIKPVAPATERVQRMLDQVFRLPKEQQQRFFQAAEALLAAMQPESEAPPASTEGAGQ